MEELRKYQADIMVVIAFGQILPKVFISISPVSIPSSICMVVTPETCSPLMTAHWIGAAPRYLGSSDGAADSGLESLAQRLYGLGGETDEDLGGPGVGGAGDGRSSGDGCNTRKYVGSIP